MSDIKSYYNSIAHIYDADRFGNSYGKFIDSEERKILRTWLRKIDKDKIADYGCGTGRLTNYANYGIDISEQMLIIAKQKFPEKKFLLLDNNEFLVSNNSLKAVYSFHVIMHLSKLELNKMFDFIYQSLEKDGIFIFDILSTRRKNNKDGWHANTAYSLEEIRKILAPKFNFITFNGILFLPIHRIPSSIRKYFLWLDILLCRSFLKYHASYYCIYAKKR
jgi:SAM-dependent methyltransferase